MDGAAGTARPNEPAASRRWRVAVLGMLVGAVAGAGGAVLRSRWRGQDAPDAQEPAQLRAVVDHGGSSSAS